MPLGEAEQSDESLLSEDEPLSGPALEIPPAIPDLQRQFALSRLIMAAEQERLGEAPSPANAARLAVALTSLLDQVETEQLSFDGLSDLVDAASPVRANNGPRTRIDARMRRTRS